MMVVGGGGGIVVDFSFPQSCGSSPQADAAMPLVAADPSLYVLVPPGPGALLLPRAWPEVHRHRFVVHAGNHVRPADRVVVAAVSEPSSLGDMPVGRGVRAPCAFCVCCPLVNVRGACARRACSAFFIHPFLCAPSHTAACPNTPRLHAGGLHLGRTPGQRVRRPRAGCAYAVVHWAASRAASQRAE